MHMKITEIPAPTCQDGLYPRQEIASVGEAWERRNSWKVGKLVVPMRVDRPWSTDVGETLEPGQGWP